MVGKHLVLPYWRLLGEDAQPDDVVLAALRKSYYKMNDPTRIYMAQQWLYLYGYEVPPTGVMDQATMTALKQAKPSYNSPSNTIDVETFVDLYTNLPIDDKTLGRRTMLAAYTQQPQTQTAQAQPAAQPQQAQEAPRKTAAAQKTSSQRKAPAAVPSAVGRTAIGRILSDSDW
jgi:hypothetical protein